MKIKFNELFEFFMLFIYKVMGQVLFELVDQVVEVVQCYVSGDYFLMVKLSSKGNYYLVFIIINVIYIEQVEMLYEELGNIDIV